MTSLSSFISSNQYNREVLSVPFVAAMRTGTGYRDPVFTGTRGTDVDPGGLFGWLVYARGRSWGNNLPAKGTSAAQYIAYTNPSDLVQDLNRLGGVTACLLSTSTAGETYSFFISNPGDTVEANTIGTQFLHAINHLAYGGTLVLAGQVAGFNKYLQDNTSSYFDVVIDPELDPTVISWLKTQEYTTGIFPSRPDETGVTGAGYTMGSFGSDAVGMSQGMKFFTVCGLKTVVDLDVSLLQANSTITYTIPAVSDVGGFFARAKNRNELYLTVAGLDRSTVINGDIVNPIEWSSTLKNSLRTNKVNFFINYVPKFLGADLVGGTAATSAITVNDRIGPARLKAAITQAINTIAFKYIFDINNQTVRNQVVSEVQTAMDPFAPYLDTTKTQIICDESNNDDNTSTLNIDVVAKPILGTDSFVINFTYTQ
jgi:hypothetical protein